MNSGYALYALCINVSWKKIPFKLLSESVKTSTLASKNNIIMFLYKFNETVNVRVQNYFRDYLLYFSFNIVTKVPISFRVSIL